MRGARELIEKALAAGLIVVRVAEPVKTGRPIVHHDYEHAKQRECMRRLRAKRRQQREEAA